MSMADRDGVIWYDGKLVPWRDATTHVLTHTLHTITISHRHHYAPQRIQHLRSEASGKLDGPYGPAGYVLTALILYIS